MTYDIIETRIDDGIPFDLYRFSIGSELMLQTNSTRPLIYNGDTYWPQPIQRSEISSTSDADKSSFNITTSKSNPLVDLFKNSSLNFVITVTVFTGHFIDDDLKQEIDPDRVSVLWKGRILNFDYNPESLVSFNMESIFTSSKQIGIRRKQQKLCPFQLYSRQCGVDKNNHKFVTTVNGINRNSDNNFDIVVDNSNIPDQFGDMFAGGYVVWHNPITNREESIGIMYSFRYSGSSNTKLEVRRKPYGLSASQTVTIYQGCSHSIDSYDGCGPRFSNYKNFGGMPYIPEKNPFDDATMY